MRSSLFSTLGVPRRFVFACSLPLLLLFPLPILLLFLLPILLLLLLLLLSSLSLPLPMGIVAIR